MPRSASAESLVRVIPGAPPTVEDASTQWGLIDFFYSYSDMPIGAFTANTVLLTLANEALSEDEMREQIHEADVSARAALAVRFAERVRDRPGLRDVMVVATEPDLLVAAVVEEADMNRDLELHAVFVDVAREFKDPSMGDLTILVEGEDELPAGKSLI
jgi:hypothetical protein